MQGLLPVLMFPALFGLIFLGLPVAFCLLTMGMLFGYAVFGNNIGLQVHGSLTNLASNFVLVAIPLFIFMGALLERSQIAENLLKALRLLLGRFPGGLSVSTILICALFAASSGVVGAVEILVGLMAVPAMVAAGYKKDLIAGSICGGGSLGTIIPPSVIVVIYASIADLSIGDLFAGILVPGLVMTVGFLAYVVVRCVAHPQDGPAISEDELDDVSFRDKIWLLFTALLPCFGLILAVIGSIFAGVASPSEAAAIGSAGALALTLWYGQFSRRLLSEALERTVAITAMTLMIMLGGSLFTNAFMVNGGGGLVRGLLASLEFGPDGTLFLFLGVIFVLGFVLDWASILLITVPIFNPVVLSLGIDPVWFAVLVCVVLQTSYLTPPMAPSIFYLQSIASRLISLVEMYRGVVPFILVQMLTLFLVYLFPSLATYMPKVLFRL
ncbi:TRAP transporter large permease subunit [Xanthobacter sp. KR7-225]|uniref:TRAP transporter large permease n=1 Tax=Xanthobacter sp. KR7-225 TaxID=3156613 RepID=UPI0032B61EF3